MGASKPNNSSPESDSEALGDELGQQKLPTGYISDTYISNPEQLAKKWTSPIYAFFKPTPAIKYVNSHHSHIFKCTGWNCKKTVQWFLDKKDSTSTSNMWKHIKSCWGEDALNTAMEASAAKDAYETVVKELNGSGTVTASFERNGKVTFLHHQHTKAKTKSVMLPC